MQFHPPPPPPAVCTCAYRLDACPVHGQNHVFVNPDKHLEATPPPPPPAPKPRLSGVGTRNKGKRGEREVVMLLQAIVDKVHRDRGLPPIVLQRNALQAHLGGEDIHGLTGFSVEVKFQECDFNPAWWRQAVAQAAKRNAVPILFYRQSRQKFRIMFRAYVNTPKDRDQLEMDIECSLDEFVEWFGNAYDESVSQ